jgi:hypothetical protein
MRLASVFALAAAIAALCAGTPAGAEPASYAGGLARVVVTDEAGLARVAASGMPVFARMGGEDSMVLITGTPAPGAGTLASTGLDARLLDADTAGKTYYICYVLPGRPSPDWTDYGEVLFEDDAGAILSMAPPDAGRLAGAGVEIRAVMTEPKPLPAPAAPRTPPLTITADPAVEAMIDAVESLTVYTYTGNLSGEWPAVIGGSPYTIHTRNTYSGTPIAKATQYAGEYLEGLGLDVEYHIWGGEDYPNVIAELPGAVSPDSIVIICGHIDDMPISSIAPGADDNASGSVSVLIAADILSRHAWHYTLRFALWTGEEQGLYGSYYYARRSYNAGEDIIAVLNLDMVAYNTPGTPRNMDLHADATGIPATVALAQVFIDVVDAYDLDLLPEIIGDGTGASDHASFWDYGYVAVLAIEDWNDLTPYYHTQNDLLQTLDMGFYVEFVKASVATFAHLGGLYDGGSGVARGGNGNTRPGATVLYPGRPNPAGPATAVRYDIAEPAHVEIKVFDAMGREVRTLVSRHHEPGTYEAVWTGETGPGERAPQGVYFIRLSSGGLCQTRKVVLLR